MEIDFEFLQTYVESEIKRLRKIVQRESDNLRGYDLDSVSARDVPEERRGWEYGRRITKLNEKIQEAKIKIENVQHKIVKLNELLVSLPTK